MTNNLEEELKKFENEIKKIICKGNLNSTQIGEALDKKRKEAEIKSRKYDDKRFIEIYEVYLEMLY